jgi:predicted DNA-binding protein
MGRQKQGTPVEQHRVCISVPTEWHDRLRRLSNKEDRSMSAELRYIIDMYCKHIKFEEDKQ